MSCKGNKMRIILCQNAEKKQENIKKEAKILCFKPYCRNFAPAVAKMSEKEVVTAAGNTWFRYPTITLLFIHTHPN